MSKSGNSQSILVIILRALAEDGKHIVRSFTPITKPGEVGKIDLLVKVRLTALV
jgi:hypothetical protein